MYDSSMLLLESCSKGGLAVRTARKILSVLLLLLIIPLLIAQITVHSLRSLLLDPTVPKQVMRQAGLYAEVEQSMVRGVLNRVRGQQESFPLPRERVARIINRVLPAQRLAQISEQLIDGLYTWAWSTDSQPVLLVDLSDVRRTLPNAVRAELEAEVAALPVCSAAQLRQLMLRPPTGMPPCKTSDEKVNAAFINQVVKDLNVEQMVPRQVDLAQELAGREGPRFWEEARQKLQPLRVVLNLVLLGWGVITILLLLLALLNLDRWYTPFGWAGAAGLLTGGPLVLAGLGGSNLLTPLVWSWVPGNPGSQAAGAAVALTIQAVSAAVRNLSFTVLLLGLAAIAVAVFGMVNEHPPESTAL